MAVVVIGLDADSDEITGACEAFRTSRLYPVLEGLGLTIATLTGASATAAGLASLLASGATFLTASAHGLPDRILGRTEPLLQVQHYAPTLVSGKIIHLLACESGDSLGPDLVQNGCRTFFGYRRPFVFPLDRPAEFLNCDSVIDQELANGATADEAYRSAIRRFNKGIKDLKNAGKMWRASVLQQNRDCLCCLGDSSARL